MFSFRSCSRVDRELLARERITFANSSTKFIFSDECSPLEVMSLQIYLFYSFVFYLARSILRKASTWKDEYTWPGEHVKRANHSSMFGDLYYGERAKKRVNGDGASFWDSTDPIAFALSLLALDQLARKRVYPPESHFLLFKRAY